MKVLLLLVNVVFDVVVCWRRMVWYVVFRLMMGEIFCCESGGLG